MAGQKGQRGVPRRQVFAPRSTAQYQDTPLAALGQSPQGIAWLTALDAIIPPTPTDYTRLFAIIGPTGNTAQQNQRIARLLGYDIDDPATRRAGLRAVQRYRRSEVAGANPRDVRGQSPTARAALLNDLAPVARAVILRRFMALTIRLGLFGAFDGWIKISENSRHYVRDGGVLGDHMSAIVTYANQDAWEDAAYGYLDEWLADWGFDPEFTSGGAAAERIADVVDSPDGDAPQWILRLGYPDDAELPVDSRELLDLMADESLVPFQQV